MRDALRGMAVMTAMLFCLVPVSTAAGGDVQAETGNGGFFAADMDVEIAVSGGLGITITVTNIGDHPIENLSWTIYLSGLIFGGISRDSGSDPVLDPGESFTASLFPFGIGPGLLTVEVNDMSASAAIWLVGPLVFGV